MSEAPSRSAGLGELLRDARERAGLELGEVAAKTHVRKTYLEALETESFDALPEDVYARNFLRLYARTVGVDPDDALARFDAARRRSLRSTRVPREGRPSDGSSASAGTALDATPSRPRDAREAPVSAAAGTTGSAPGPSRRRDRAAPERDPQRVRPGVPAGVMPLLMTIVLAGALVGVAVWGFNQLLFRPENNVALTPPTADPVAEADPVAGSAVAPAEGGLAAPVVPGGDALPDEVLLTVATEPPGAEVSVDAFPLPGTTPIQGVPISARDERTLRITREGYEPYEGTFDMTFDRDLSINLEPLATETPADGEAPAAADLGTPEGEVVLVVNEPTWLEAYQSTARGQGERLVYTTAQPGERFAFSRPLYLHVGNAAGLEVSVDGGPFGSFGSGGAVTGQAYPAR